MMPSVQPQPVSRRRLLASVEAGACVLFMPFMASAGCSNTSKKKARSGGRAKGPKTMGNLLVDGYVADLQKGPAEKRITAAKELGNMGAAAKASLPALEALTKDGNAKVRDAVKQAIASIRR